MSLSGNALLQTYVGQPEVFDGAFLYPLADRLSIEARVISVDPKCGPTSTDIEHLKVWAVVEEGDK